MPLAGTLDFTPSGWVGSTLEVLWLKILWEMTNPSDPYSSWPRQGLIFQDVPAIHPNPEVLPFKRNARHTASLSLTVCSLKNAYEDGINNSHHSRGGELNKSLLVTFI